MQCSKSRLFDHLVGERAGTSRLSVLAVLRLITLGVLSSLRRPLLSTASDKVTQLCDCGIIRLVVGENPNISAVLVHEIDHGRMIIGVSTVVLRDALVVDAIRLRDLLDLSFVAAEAANTRIERRQIELQLLRRSIR